MAMVTEDMLYVGSVNEISFIDLNIWARLKHIRYSLNQLPNKNLPKSLSAPIYRLIIITRNANTDNMGKLPVTVFA